MASKATGTQIAVVEAPPTEVAPSGPRWTHASQTQNARGRFAVLPHPRPGVNSRDEKYIVVTYSRANETHEITGCGHTAATNLCEMNGDGVSWTWAESVIGHATMDGKGRPAPPPIWRHRGQGVVLAHYSPRDRPPEGVLVAMQTESQGREQYLLGFYDHNDERWMVLSKPAFFRQPMKEPPIRWCAVEEAIRSGLREQP